MYSASMYMYVLEKEEHSPTDFPSPPPGVELTVGQKNLWSSRERRGWLISIYNK
jgi:hypothetical protein